MAAGAWLVEHRQLRVAAGAGVGGVAGGSRGLAGWSYVVGGLGESTHRARVTFADLIGVPVGDVAVGAAVSQLLAPVAAALPAGATVVVPEVEFTSNLFPWLVQEERGVTVRTVPLESLVDAIDADTDLVAFSLVQSADGAIAAYDEIVAAARAHDALVVVDATQACGWLPFDGSRADAVAVGGYKWLMDPRGTAYAYLAPGLRERLRPDAAGWYAGRDPHASYYGPPLRLADDARRFDISPAWFSWVGAAPALERGRGDRRVGDRGAQRDAGQPVPDRAGPGAGGERHRQRGRARTRSSASRRPASGRRCAPDGSGPRSTSTPPRPTWTRRSRR